MEGILEVLASIRTRDLIDIALLTAIIYWLLQLIKGTRTIPILLGLTVLLAAYGLAEILDLAAISWLMQNLFSAAVVILVVLFQADIRNALARLGISTMFREISATAQNDLIAEVAEAATTLARRKIGASIVLEKETGLRNYIDRGVRLMAEPTVELFLSIFHTSSPLHDGAVIINREGKLAAARCILPLTSNPAASKRLGTRHRSALGLTEESDALVVIVSEERGKISLASRGELIRDLAPAELRTTIAQLLQGEGREDAISESPPQTKTA
jgi:uncharacterized protein (TIGR00159 family)